MAPLWFVSFVSIMAACGNALTWTSEQGAQNGPDTTRHTRARGAREQARAGARESTSGAREGEQARARAGARESRRTNLRGTATISSASDFSALGGDVLNYDIGE